MFCEPLMKEAKEHGHDHEDVTETETETSEIEAAVVACFSRR